MNPVDRRRLLQFLLLGGITSQASAFWFGDDDEEDQAETPRRQIHKLKGDVQISGNVASASTLISPGDEIVTGDNSMIVFHQGKDAYLLRSNTRMQLEKGLDDYFVDTLRILGGAVLSVYGSGRKRIITPVATAGIRGTGTYFEVEDNETYLCTCYGEVDFTANDDPGVTEALSTTHHESPRYIRQNSVGSYMVEARPINHTDTELIMLEATVDRAPPFITEEYDPDADY